MTAPVQTYLDGATSNRNSTDEEVTVPGDVPAGSCALLFIDNNSSSATVPTAPSGWTQIGSMENVASTDSLAYWKKLVSGDLGALVDVEWPTGIKSAVTVVVYSNVDVTGNPIDAFAQNSTSPASTAHTTPTIAAVTAGAIAIEHVSDKGASGNTSWTAPSGVTARLTVAVAGTANPSASTGESTTSYAAGAMAGGHTWTSGQTAVGNAWTILLKPASAPAPPTPVATEYFAKSGSWVTLPSFYDW